MDIHQRLLLYIVIFLYTAIDRPVLKLKSFDIFLYGLIHN